MRPFFFVGVSHADAKDESLWIPLLVKEGLGVVECRKEPTGRLKFLQTLQ